MSGIEPTIRLEQDGMFTRVNMEYTNDALDAMAQRAAERIEDELVQQILARLGYVKVVLCRDCRWASIDQTDHESREGMCCKLFDIDLKPYGYCAWGKRKGVAE